MARRAEPVRTCVGCRSRAARSDLLRIVVVGGELVPDVRRRMPGRGAHVHPDPACLDLAERRRAFPRALRVPGPLALERVRAHVRQVQAGSDPAL
ncbi:MAG: YlxR family protein [Frankia sp.]|nr:YlxR family protein [Frankia sp.]